jgi:L-threonylcarbamoyladenylate synthase
LAVTDGTIRLLRPGPVVLPGIALTRSEGIEAPGQMAAHYAPSKPLRINAKVARDGEWMIGFGPITGTVSLSLSGDLIEASARLFALLHDADANDYPAIAVAPVPDTGLGVAINDRLRRAATR